MAPIPHYLRALPKLHLYLLAGVLAVITLAAMFLPEEQSTPSPNPPPLAVNEVDDSTNDTPAHDDIERVSLPVSLSDPDKATIPADNSVAANTVVPVEPTQTENVSSPALIPAAVENWTEYNVRSGDNLTTIFKRAGLGPRDVYQVSQAASSQDALKYLKPGQTLAFLIEGGELRKLKHVRSRLQSTLIERTPDGYVISEQERTPEAQSAYAEADIRRSLFLDAADAGLPQRTIMQLAQIFGWDIDFALDIREGDHFRVLYEQDYLDGEALNSTRILAAQFMNRGNTYTAIRFTDSQGNSNYFSPDGHSMRKAFLRSPVDFRRISSHFKPERYHPVLGRKRPHRGVDYAAATGTPIKAAGDGKVIWRGTKGGYGRTVILQHGGNITTLYAHMSRYQKGVSNGTRVKQGQTIGYVGASGLATGPHLHYEFRSNGVHRNPLTVDLPAADPVPANERDAFLAEANRLVAELERHSDTRLAMNDESGQP